MADTKIIAGNGATNQGGSADQSTVAGSGLSGDEFRTGVLEYPNADVLLPGATPVGTPLRIDSATGPSLRYGTSNVLHDSFINGLRAPNRGGNFVIQSSGKLKLTTAEWDAITGGSGGLTVGAGYFLQPMAGKLAIDPPAGGQFTTYVGYAIEIDTMQLAIACTGVAQ